MPVGETANRRLTPFTSQDFLALLIFIAAGFTLTTFLAHFYLGSSFFLPRGQPGRTPPPFGFDAGLLLFPPGW